MLALVADTTLTDHWFFMPPVNMNNKGLEDDQGWGTTNLKHK